MAIQKQFELGKWGVDKCVELFFQNKKYWLTDTITKKDISENDILKKLIRNIYDTKKWEEKWEEEKKLYKYRDYGNSPQSTNSIHIMLQKYKGDILLSQNNHIMSTEIKAERNNPNDNFFIETYSNKKWGKIGWLFDLDVDWLFYCFQKKKRETHEVIYKMKFDEMKKYSIKNRHKYREIEQTKNKQPNDTWGLLIPIKHFFENITISEHLI